MSLPFGSLAGIPEPNTTGGLLDMWRVPVVRLRPGEGGKDRYGVPIPGALVPVDLPPGLFFPQGSADAIAAGVQGTVTEPTVMWPQQSPDVAVGDVLEIDGDRWRVHERPQDWPLGLVVTLKGAESPGGAP